MDKVIGQGQKTHSYHVVTFIGRVLFNSNLLDWSMLYLLSNSGL